MARTRETRRVRATFLLSRMGSYRLVLGAATPLASAVLIDATVVRGILVPAALALLGERSWYLPRWLEWLPGGRPRHMAP